MYFPGKLLLEGNIWLKSRASFAPGSSVVLSVVCLGVLEGSLYKNLSHCARNPTIAVHSYGLSATVSSHPTVTWKRGDIRMAAGYKWGLFCPGQRESSGYLEVRGGRLWKWKKHMERKRVVLGCCLLEVFGELKAPNFKSNSKWYFMTCGIKKMVVTFFLVIFLLFLGFLLHVSIFGYIESWTLRVGDSIMFWVKHGVSSQRWKLLLTISVCLWSYYLTTLSFWFLYKVGMVIPISQIFREVRIKILHSKRFSTVPGKFT